MEDLRDRLAHVLWIGGGPNVGKTTLSRLLAGKYDLKIYNLDWHHVREHRFLPGGAPAGWDELSMDDRWVSPTPEQLAAREIASWTDRFPLVVEDLLRRPADRPVIAEGPSVFPWSVSAVIRSPNQAIFLIPTTEFADRVYQRRHSRNPDQSPHRLTNDPDRARANVRARNELMAERIVASCEELGLRYVRVDGSSDLDDSLALLEDHFRPHLPATLNV
jgi:hypothetical protein